jgi:hypothetical protein
VLCKDSGGPETRCVPRAQHLPIGPVLKALLQQLGDKVDASKITDEMLGVATTTTMVGAGARVGLKASGLGKS